jgi:hypothetical protein
VRDSNQNPVAGAGLFYTWSNNRSNNCTTGSNGQCSLTSDRFMNAAVNSISLTVDNVSHEQVLVYSYQPAGNTDPDGDSNGTTITVNQP